MHTADDTPSKTALAGSDPEHTRRSLRRRVIADESSSLRCPGIHVLQCAAIRVSASLEPDEQIQNPDTNGNLAFAETTRGVNAVAPKLKR